MELPAFYDPPKVGTLFAPDTSGAIQAASAVGAKPAAQDKNRIALILVDVQVDFVHVDGALSVPGAVDDTRRTIEWMFRNLGQITTIIASLDTHVPMQIFYPGWWVNDSGQHPAPFSAITAADLSDGTWRPTVETQWSREYVQQLEELGKKTLIIWPYHTMIGTPGHSITPALYEAIIYHSASRLADPIFLSKGSIPKTEHYSILEPEIKVADQPLGTLNMPIVKLLSTCDLVYFAGQAKSHCVLETITSLYRHFADRDRDQIARWRFLEDCTSSVAHPEIDFEAIANAQLSRLAQEGMRMVKASDSIG